MADDGIRSAHQVQAEGPNKEIRNLKVDAEGNLLVSGGGGGAGGVAEEVGTIVHSAAGTTATELNVGYNVTSILLANLSEGATLTIMVDAMEIPLPANIAIEVPVNKAVTKISITSTVENTPFYIVVKRALEEG